MKTLKPNAKTIIVTSFLALSIISAPFVSFADNNKEKDNNKGGIRIEQHDEEKSNKGLHLGWGKMIGWFGTHGNSTTTPATQKPVISNLTVVSTKPHKATITWTTDLNSSSMIWYGTTSPVNTTSTTKMTRHMWGGLNHKITLKKLEPNTKYYVIVASANAAGKTISSEISFTTPATPITPTNIAPVIASHANITVAATSSAGAVVTYTSPNVTDDIDATTTATCLPTSGSTFAIGTTTVLCNHTDTNGHAAIQTSFTVTVTADTTKPVVTNIGTSSAITTSTITWTTDEPATSKVFYSTSTPVDLNTSPTVTNATLSTSHSLQITGLSASTLYYFVIESTDASANKTDHSELTFTTSS